MVDTTDEFAGLLSGMEAEVISFLKEAAYAMFCDALQGYCDSTFSENRDPNRFTSPVDKAHQWRGAAIMVAKFILMAEGRPTRPGDINAIVQKMNKDSQQRHAKEYPNFFKRQK